MTVKPSPGDIVTWADHIIKLDVVINDSGVRVDYPGSALGLVLESGVRIFDDGVEALVAWPDGSSTWEHISRLKRALDPEV